MNGTFTATIDRVVDQQTAVILIEDDGEVVEQYDVQLDQLPDAVQREGVVLTVELADSEIVSIQHEPDETRQRHQAAQERLDRLSKPLSDKDQREE